MAVIIVVDAELEEHALKYYRITHSCSSVLEDVVILKNYLARSSTPGAAEITMGRFAMHGGVVTAR